MTLSLWGWHIKGSLKGNIIITIVVVVVVVIIIIIEGKKEDEWEPIRNLENCRPCQNISRGIYLFLHSFTFYPRSVGKNKRNLLTGSSWPL